MNQSIDSLGKWHSPQMEFFFTCFLKNGQGDGDEYV